MKIRYTSPYSTTKNLSDAYMEEISLGGDYVVFMDRDIIPPPNYGHIIETMVGLYPDSYMTCYASRTNCPWQKWDNVKGNDIPEHMEEASRLWKQNGTKVEDHTHSQLWSGHLMVCPVRGFKRLRKRGLLGVDNEIHLNGSKNHKILLITGLYVYHYYSNHDGGQKNRDKSHLL